MTFYWTNENEFTLRKMWAVGDSGDDIRRAIGAPTRNTVMGKIHRLGLCRNAAGSEGDMEQKRKPRAKRRQPFRADTPRPLRFLPLALPIEPAVQVQPQHTAPAPSPATPSNPVTLLELTDQTCRWPIGDPQEADFHFCGVRPIAESPYCNGHHLIAYSPAPRRTTLTQEERVRRQRMERTGSARAFS